MRRKSPRLCYDVEKKFRFYKKKEEEEEEEEKVGNVEVLTKSKA